MFDFEAFIDAFLAALRDFDRHRRGAAPRRPGHPELRATAVTAFRLVQFLPGSGIATLEPEATPSLDAGTLIPEEFPPALENLKELVETLDAGSEMSGPVTEALSKACRAFGNDGSIQIHLPKAVRSKPIRIDASSLTGASSTGEPEMEEVRNVSGRLHLLDIEPDKLAIRTSTGVDWVCNYPERLEPRVKQLVDRIVWVEGTGRLVTPQRGTMEIEGIEVVEEGEQTTLFTEVPVPDDELLVQQRITAPQGLQSLADTEWNEETDDAYLDALIGR